MFLDFYISKCSDLSLRKIGCYGGFMRFIFSALILFTVLSLPAYAENEVKQFNERCEEAGKTASFCNCALSAFSDQMRKRDTRKLEESKLHLKYSTDTLLADPVMTQGKIDAVCGLYDEVQVYGIKSALVKREKGHNHARQWVDKKLAVMKRKEELVMSYGASRQTNGALAAGDYCKLNNEVNQMSQDLAESNDVIYARVRRMIEWQAGLQPFFSSAYKAGCK